MFQRYLYGGSVLHIAQKITKNHHHSRKYEGTFYWNICFLAFSYFHFDINFLLLAKYFKGCKQTGKILKARPLHGNDRFSPLQTELSSLVHSSFHQFHNLQWLLLSGPKRLKENFSVFTVLKNVEQKEITYKVTACSLSFVFQNRFQVITPSVPVVLN